MRIDDATCTGCGECIPYCPVDAIALEGGLAAIDQDRCVECGTCMRVAPCPTESIFRGQDSFEWPRSVRTAFSDPLVPHKETGVRGRGTEEVKTNDVTGRVKRGRIGMAMEFGRPGVGTDFHEVEKMTMALAQLGANFEPNNPLTFLMEDVCDRKDPGRCEGRESALRHRRVRDRAVQAAGDRPGGARGRQWHQERVLVVRGQPAGAQQGDPHDAAAAGAGLEPASQR